MKTTRTLRSFPAAVVLLVLAVALLVAPHASACPVCYGETDSGILDGARLSVLFMGLLTYGLIGGGLGIFLALRRRVRRLQEQEQDPRKGLYLVGSPSSSEGVSS